MPQRAGGRGSVWALVAVAGLGAVLRAGPLLAYGTYGSRPDYDDGVNFTAAALLTSGTVPYRDFFYAHPPGGLLFLAPFGLLARLIDANDAFAVAGLAFVLVGAVTTFLLGRLCWTLWGPVAGFLAALLYAVHPEVLVAERTTFMEPVLNLACIALATLWLTSDERPSAAGAVAGFALTVKAWAIGWVVSALVSLPRRNRLPTLARYAATVAATALAITLPFAVFDFGGFLDGTVRFHLWRPPDGTLSISGRIHEILGFLPDSWSIADGRHAATGVLAVGGLAVALVRCLRAEHRGERYFASAFVLTVVAFLFGQSYFTHYNAHSGLAETALAGCFAGALWDWVTARQWDRLPPVIATRLVPALLAAGLLVAPWMSLQESLDDADDQSPELEALAGELRRLPDRDAATAPDCLYSFEPTWGVAGGRLPPTVDGAPVVLDPYGAMVFRAVEDGDRFDGMAEAFADEASQPEILAALSACRFVVLGGRGDLQLTEASKAWFRERYAPRSEGASPIQIWERLEPAP